MLYWMRITIKFWITEFLCLETENNQKSHKFVTRTVKLIENISPNRFQCMHINFENIFNFIREMVCFSYTK